ncbi:MAG TPA: FG-GAP-like repeat-containing protein [Anaerolineae bacterium]|nr:FG-GAP-like repeat-containing protein [Anaerolineae bacterium]
MTSSNNRLYFIIGGVLVLIIAVGLVWWFNRSNDTSPSLTPGLSTTPLTLSATNTSPLFSQLTPDQTGINFQNDLPVPLQQKYTYNGAGVAAGDYDNDGLVDIFMQNQSGQSRLFRNTGNLQFEDTTEAAGLLNVTDPGGLSMAAHFADLDNDNDLDLFIANWKTTNKLFFNNGDGTFTDVTTTAGVNYAGGTNTIAVADYDRDGDLDLYLATYRPHAIEYENQNIRLQQAADGTIIVPPELQDRLEIISVEGGRGTLRELGERDILYQNNGDGTFTDVAAQAGIVGGYWGLSSIFADIDNDQWLDLYVTNDLWSPDTFYHNNGDGTFSLISPDMIQHTPRFAMGIDFADINNDGLQDYFIGDMVSRDHEKRMTQHGEMDASEPPTDFADQLMRNTLYINNGDGSFSDIAWLADLAFTDWTWTAKFSDLDLDSYVDLLITNGMVRDLMDSDYAERTREIGITEGRQAVLDFIQEYPLLDTSDYVFRNNGDLTFTDVSNEWNFNVAAIGHGAAIADFDNDGDNDIIVNYMNDPALIFRNNSDNNRITVRLLGQTSNRLGLDARVTLTTNQGQQTRFMSTSGGYLSSHDAHISFGLGDTTAIQSIHVLWPSGLEQTFTDLDGQPLPINHQYTIVEPNEPANISPPQRFAPTNPQFVEVSTNVGLTRRHIEAEEKAFDEFEEQALLPYRLSVFGPGAAWADPDNDGDDDIYIAGGANQAGSLYQNNGDGTFTDITNQNRWQIAAEEMAPLWWTPAANANPNLLLSYSTLETPSLPLATRYDLTNPAAIATQQADWAPTADHSSSSLAAADFDGDGDLDLFLGGRLRLNRWPEAVSSILYRNDNGQLTDVTASNAPELANLGLATGALWLDVDNDNDPDLLVATEWGPIHLFRNDNGQLTRATTASNLDNYHGIWQGLAASDFNGDGHLDFAATNISPNTRHQATADRPNYIYAGNVDDDGDVDIIEAYYDQTGTLYPWRFLGMAEVDMPFLAAKYETHRAFAQDTLEEIYGERLLRPDVFRLQLNHTPHTLFLNDGNGRFQPTPLPLLSQTSLSFGIVASDFDNDGFDDLYFAGNFRHADHETIAYDGGVSYWLRGHGDGTFTPVPTVDSGLFLPEEARGVALADYDNDGWVDILVTRNNTQPALFHNQGQDGHNSVRVRLQGPPANPTAVGARITITHSDGHTVTREIHAGSSYLSQDSATLVFGLGPATTATATVRWPDGTTTQHDLTAGQLATLSP